MELFSPIALTYLIPRYHEKYADCILMFFRMNNIGVFEACREVREQFLNLIETQEFKQRFQREFFSEDGTMFDLEKYNTFALLVMIKMCHRIFSRFVFGETVLIGGKKRVATRRHKKDKKTRKLYGGSPVQEISQNLQLQEKNLAIQTFLSQVPYNGILGVDEFDNVSAFILQQVFPTSFQDYFKQNEGSFYCVSLVTLYVQHLVPAMIPFDTIREFLFQNPQENQVGGQKTKKRFFVPQWKGRTQKIKQKPIPKQPPLELSNLRPYNERRKLYEPQLRNKTAAESGFLPSSSEFLEEVTQQRKPLLQAPQHPMQFLLLTLLQINVQRPMTQEEIAEANARYLFPDALVAQTMLELYYPPIQKGVAAQDTIPSTCAKGRNGTFYCGRGTNKVKKNNNNQNNENNQNNQNNTNKAEEYQIQESRNGPADFCYTSEPLEPPKEGELHGTLDEGVINAFRAFHAVSATNISGVEWSALVLIDDNGVLTLNATVRTDFERRETIISGGNIPENTVAWIHLHPWEIQNRVVSPMSGADLEVTISQFFWKGTPYGIAYAPEGLYLYSPQQSFFDFLKPFVFSKEGMMLYDNMRVINKVIKDIKPMIDNVKENFPSILKCDKISSTNITALNNIGILSNGVPVGFDIQFISNGDLSKGYKMNLNKFTEVRGNPLIRRPFEETPPSKGFTAEQLWNSLFNSTFKKEEFQKRTGKNNWWYPYLNPIPYFGKYQISARTVRSVHPYPFKSLVEVILKTPEMFIKFQKHMNEYFKEQAKRPENTYYNTEESKQKLHEWDNKMYGIIQNKFHDAFKDVLPKLLSEPIGKGLESARRVTNETFATIKEIRRLYWGQIQVTNRILLNNAGYGYA